MNLASQFERSNNVVNTKFILQRDLKLLSNAEATLEQRWNFDLWHQRHYNVVYWLYNVVTLPQRCHNVVCLVDTKHFFDI